jgi:CHAD domain-containing protein
MNAIELADDLEGWSDNWMSEQNKENVFAEHAAMLRKQAKEIEYWKEMFEKAMSVNEQIKHLEAQVYGGTTK